MKSDTALNLVTLALALTTLVVGITAPTLLPFVLPPLGLAIVLTVRRVQRESH